VPTPFRFCLRETHRHATPKGRPALPLLYPYAYPRQAQTAALLRMEVGDVSGASEGDASPGGREGQSRKYPLPSFCFHGLGGVPRMRHKDTELLTGGARIGCRFRYVRDRQTHSIGPNWNLRNHHTLKTTWIRKMTAVRATPAAGPALP